MESSVSLPLHSLTASLSAKLKLGIQKLKLSVGEFAPRIRRSLVTPPTPISLRPALFVGVSVILLCLGAHAQPTDFHEIDTQFELAIRNPAPGLAAPPQVLEYWRNAGGDAANTAPKVSLVMIETSNPDAAAVVTALVARAKAESGDKAHILYADMSGERTPQSFRQSAEIFANNPELRTLPEQDVAAITTELKQYRVENEAAFSRYNVKQTMLKFVTASGIFYLVSNFSRDLPTAAHLLSGIWMGTLCAFNQITLMIFNDWVFRIPDAMFRGLDRAQRGVLKFFGIEEMFARLGLKIPFADFAADLASRDKEGGAKWKTIPKKFAAAMLVFPYLIVNYGLYGFGDAAITHFFAPMEYGAFDLKSISTTSLAAFFSYMAAAKTDFFGEGVPHLLVNNVGHQRNATLLNRQKWIASMSMTLSLFVTLIAAGSDIMHLKALMWAVAPVAILGGIGYFFDTFIANSKIAEAVKEKLKRKKSGPVIERRLHCIMMMSKR